MKVLILSSNMKEVLIFFGKVIVNVILIFAAQLFH
ncbi:MAG: hypothetical protein ACI9JN_002739, partial [Bacteroidia bacterium]